MRLERRTAFILGGAAVAIAIFTLSLYAVVLNDSDAEAPAANAGLLKGSVVVNYDNSGTTRPQRSRPFEVAPAASAWDAIKQAVGESNVTFQDFGGDLGILITGFDGVTLSGNRFWEFRVNGTPADVGVSTYKVKDGDVLEFRVGIF